MPQGCVPWLFRGGLKTGKCWKPSTRRHCLIIPARFLSGSARKWPLIARDTHSWRKDFLLSAPQLQKHQERESEKGQQALRKVPTGELKPHRLPPLS